VVVAGSMNDGEIYVWAMQVMMLLVLI